MLFNPDNCAILSEETLKFPANFISVEFDGSTKLSSEYWWMPQKKF